MCAAAPVRIEPAVAGLVRTVVAGRREETVGAG